MARKVKLAFVLNNAKRKEAYKKRKSGLIKKMSEITTLCGTSACAIIYSTYNSEPEVWPNNLQVQNVISRFNRMPSIEKNKNMFNQETYLQERIVKVREKLKKQNDVNGEKEILELMFQCLSIGKARLLDLTLPNLDDLQNAIVQNLKKINKLKEGSRNMDPMEEAAP